MRLKAMKSPRYANGFEVTCHEDALKEPLHWRKPRRVFVCSMGDLFHKDVPLDFIKRVFVVMQRCSQHQFQVLTKRPNHMRYLSVHPDGVGPWPDNVWAGTTIENRNYVDRQYWLVASPVKTRFLSCEPLLSSIPNLPLKGIDWVIVGGESGPGARPMDLAWARDIRDQCKAAGVPFFFKQVGGFPNKWSNLEDIPPDLRIREYPQ